MSSTDTGARHWERFLKAATHRDEAAASTEPNSQAPLVAPQAENALATNYEVRVYFRVAINTGFGQKVCVVGGWPKLGDWDPAKGLPLTTTDEVFPVWFSREPVYLPLKQPIYYQYVVVSDQTGEVIAWDTHAQSRKIRPTGYEMTVEDDEGLYRALTRGGGGGHANANLRSPLFRMRDQQLGSQVQPSPRPPSAPWSSSDAFDSRVSETPKATRRSRTGTSLATFLNNGENPPTSDNVDGRPENAASPRDATPSLPPIGSTGGALGGGGGVGGARPITSSSASVLNPRTSGDLERTLDDVKLVSVDASSSPTVDALEAIKKLRETEVEAHFDPDDTIIVVSFELPVRVECVGPSADDFGDDSTSSRRSCQRGAFRVVPSNSLLLPGLHRIRDAFKCHVKFVGYSGITTRDEFEQDTIRALLEEHDCHPVFPSAEELDAYLSFCNHHLSPLFHSVIDLDNRQEPFSPEAWTTYQAINKLWASEAVVHYNGDADVFWVHDYHLMLVPQYIARRYKRANIGFFLHVPFPSSELFRCLPVRGEILRGLLCADLVGFHFFEYARHFFVANKRLLGLDHKFRLGGFLGIEYGGRNVMIKISHVNVEYNELQQRLESREDIQEVARNLRQAYHGKYIFGAIDRCDQLAGLMLKLRGFHNFLNNFPYARGKVVLIQYAYPTRQPIRDAMRISNDLTMLANKINSEFGPDPHVVLRLQTVSPEEKYGILTAADCLLDTSIRDGLNLLAFEYIGCRKNRPSHLILSEFTGCSRTIVSATRINPWQLDDIANALDRAMSTPAEALKERWARDHLYLSQHSLRQWAGDFLADLQRSKKNASAVYMQCGFASTFRVLTMGENFQPLDHSRVVRAYRTATRRMLFFDHEGTLAPDRRHLTVIPGQEALSAVGTPPSQAVKSALETLARDSSNTVVIFSGRDRKCLEGWFGDVPDIGLCAEHGFYAKIPAVTGNQWHCMSENVDLKWKNIALELMLQYTRRTQGAFIENKGSALVFQYRDADPDFGSWQAKELASYLEEFLFGQPVTVTTGKGYVEAMLRGVNKGAAVEHVLGSLTSVFGEPQFILCVGDDRSDEDMFVVIRELMRRNREQLKVAQTRPSGGRMGADLVDESAVFTVTVGKKPSAAKYFVNDTEEVSDLLNSLRSQTHQMEGIVDANAIVGGLLRVSGSRDDFDTTGSAEGVGVEHLWPGAESMLGLEAAPTLGSVAAHHQRQEDLLEHLCVD